MRTLVAMALMAILVAPCATRATGSELDVSISGAGRADTSEDGVVRVSVRNNGNRAVFLPKVFTPLFTPDGHLMNNVLEVTDKDGNAARFIGRYLHVVPTDPATFYAQLYPGEAVSHDVRLDVDYALIPGKEYVVSYRQRFAHAYREDAQGTLSDDGETTSSNTFAFRYAGSAN